VGLCFEVVIKLHKREWMERPKELFPMALGEVKRCARKLLGRQEDSDDDGLEVSVGDITISNLEGRGSFSGLEQLVKVRKLGWFD
jgi:hypothetical protein